MKNLKKIILFFIIAFAFNIQTGIAQVNDFVRLLNSNDTREKIEIIQSSFIPDNSNEYERYQSVREL